MEKIFLSSDGIKKLVPKVKIYIKVIIDDWVFRLHYRFTALMCLVFSILVTGTQYFGDPIHCIQKDDIPEKLLNTYCWIESTFTMPNKTEGMIIGEEIVAPGVIKREEGDYVKEHAYYQWVCFVLLLQAVFFYVPRAIWFKGESGLIKRLLQGLKSPVISADETEKQHQNLVNYFRGHLHRHEWYVHRYFACEVINFLHVIIEIYFIDLFLGGEFTTFGSDVVKFANTPQENRTDPMIRVFPRVTKCSFSKFGSGGSVQIHDALCLLPMNILNEKIYIFLWFWLVILAVLSGIMVVFRLSVLLSENLRYVLMKSVSLVTPTNIVDDCFRCLYYGDWFVLLLLGYNMDPIHYNRLLSNIPCCRRDDGNRPGNIKMLRSADEVDNPKESVKLLKNTEVDPDGNAKAGNESEV